MPLLSRDRSARVTDSLWAMLIMSIFFGLRLFPARFASAAGEPLGRWLGHWRNPEPSRAALQNLRRLRPKDSESDREIAVARMWGHVGRVQAEMAVIDRLWSAATITVRNEESLLRALGARRPIVFVFAHLGNWELLAIGAQRLGAVLNVVYEVLPDRFELELAMRARAALGYRLITPDLVGMRQILAALGRGEAVALAIDEYKNGNVVAPRFGRRRRAGSNAELVERLARRFDALVVPGYCIRTAPLDFTIQILDPIERPHAAELENLCESWIRAQPEQWYMLPRLRLPPQGANR